MNDNFDPVQVLWQKEHPEVMIFTLIICASVRSSQISQMQDDPLLFDVNIDIRVDDFILAAMVQVKTGISNHWKDVHLEIAWELICFIYAGKCNKN